MIVDVADLVARALSDHQKGFSFHIGKNQESLDASNLEPRLGSPIASAFRGRQQSNGIAVGIFVLVMVTIASIVIVIAVRVWCNFDYEIMWTIKGHGKDLGLLLLVWSKKNCAASNGLVEILNKSKLQLVLVDDFVVVVVRRHIHHRTVRIRMHIRRTLIDIDVDARRCNVGLGLRLVTSGGGGGGGHPCFLCLLCYVNTVVGRQADSFDLSVFDCKYRAVRTVLHILR
mmetsp:Transcript_9321/g.20208  ORF Transcript_9321/g.20208 Transcript_9321/m.20208 type:complete len:229 (-) Transcript_9321:503-1189(-)